MERVEQPQPQKLQQPPAPRAKDLAPPSNPFQPAASGARSTAAPRPSTWKLPDPSYPRYQAQHRAPNEPQTSTSPTQPQAAAPHLPAPANTPPPPVEIRLRPSPYQPVRPVYQPPDPVSAYVPPSPTGAVPRVGYPQRLPGQASPPPFPTPLGERRAKEKQLEDAYLQSRADALNMKYHGGRPVLNKYSPEVGMSAAAPPSVHLPPSIPGSRSDLPGAFRASEVKRQEWQAYRNQPHTSLPGQPPMPSLPRPPMPAAGYPSVP